MNKRVVALSFPSGRVGAWNKVLGLLSQAEVDGEGAKFHTHGDRMRWKRLSHQCVGWSEDGRPYQPLQFLHPRPGGLLGGKARDQRLDFLLLRQEDPGRRPGFFFTPTVASCSRVWAMTRCAYCSTKSWNWA